MKNKREYIYWSFLLGLCFFAYCIQVNSYLYEDSAVITHTAAQMLQGQLYAREIFEPNPPLIFYLHMPPILLSNLMRIRLIYSLPLYMLSLIVFSVTCSRYLFEKLFQNNVLFVYTTTFAFALILLFLPVSAFGEREHFLLILTTPYILLTACRLDNRVINKSVAILIGIMAGIGFSIKPFFLLSLLLIELLLVIRQKSLWGWVRIESVFAVCFILIYILSVLFFFPSYWQLVLPLWAPYYQGIMQPWETLLSYFYFWFCCSALLLFCFSKKDTPNASIHTLLALTIFGYLVAFLIPRVTWYYHILPALSLSCLYFVLVLTETGSELTVALTQRASRAGFLILLAIVIFFRPVMACVIATVDRIQVFHSNTPLSQLASFLNKQAPDTTYDFFSMTLPLYNLEYYSTLRYVGNVSILSWEFMSLSPSKYSEAYREKIHNFMLKIISRDLNHKKPEFVIIDVLSSLSYLSTRIDYLRLYASNELFHKAWSHYSYRTTIGPYVVYQRKILN